MKLSQKDKSLLLFIAAALVVLWGVLSISSSLFFSATFRFSDANKIISGKEQQWLNISRPLEISDLKDRIILLDFWSYGCVSCIETLPELKKLEKEYGSKLLIIGVHSAKFANEKEAIAVKKAVLRNDITYPVVNDSDLKIYNKFKVKALPTFVLINPNGREVETFSGVNAGVNDVEKIKGEIKKLISKFKYEIKRDPLPVMLEKYNVIGNVLSFPTKLEYVANLSYKSRQIPVIFIANSSQNNIVATSLSGDIIFKIGSAAAGFENGSFDVASFNAPRGLLFDGNKLYIADSGNHALRVVDFKEGVVSTLVGSGTKGDVIESENFSEAKSINLASPNDL